MCVSSLKWRTGLCFLAPSQPSLFIEQPGTLQRVISAGKQASNGMTAGGSGINKSTGGDCAAIGRNRSL